MPDVSQRTLAIVAVGALVCVGLLLAVVLAERAALHRTLRDIRGLPEREAKQ